MFHLNLLHEVHFLLTKGDTPVVGGESSVVAMETDSVCTTDELQVVKNSAQKKLDDKMAEEERDMKINWIVKFVSVSIYIIVLICLFIISFCTMI